MSEIAHETHGDLERLKKRFLTVKDLADKLNVSEKTIYSYVSQNRLPYMKIESNVRFDSNAISEWLKAKLSSPSGSKGGRRVTTHGKSRASNPTARDFDVLRSFTIRRYLSTSQVQGLHFPSIRTANRRLQFLLRKGYLGRFSLAMKRDQGASEFVYYLKRAGYEALSINPPAHVSSNPKPGRSSGPKSLAYMVHFLEASDFWISLQRACEESEVTLVRFTGYDPDSDLCEGLEEGIEIRPDSFFVLANKEGNRALFFVEVDRGTEKISSKEYYSFEKKVSGYLNFFRKAVFKRFGEFAGFRVLVIAPTIKRLENLRQAVSEMGIQRLFWFCLRKDVIEKNVLTTALWLLPEGDERLQLVKGKSNEERVTMPASE